MMKLVLLACFMCLCYVTLVSTQMVTKNMLDPERGIKMERDLEVIKQMANSVKGLRQLQGSHSTLAPVVAVPGVGGSQLYAMLNKTKDDHWYCRKTTDWFRLWLEIESLVPGPPTQCFLEHMNLGYNKDSRTFSNSTGTDIIAYEFGSTVGFEYLDPGLKKQTLYFAAIVDALLTVGYSRKVNLFGAPYDWRLAPASHTTFFPSLKQLIETAYKMNNNTKVVLVAHSMGTMYTHYFLTSQPQSWRDTYIKAWVPIAPPLTGSVEAVQSLASGYDFSIPILSPGNARIIQRTFESNYFLLPNPQYWQDQVLVNTPATNYSSATFSNLFKTLRIENADDIYQPTLKQMNPMTTPNVDTYCFYGFNVSTVMRLSYPKGNFEAQPTMYFGDGDGTVPIQSLTFCKNWQSQKSKLVVKGYPNQEHVDILSSQAMIADLLSIILN